MPSKEELYELITKLNANKGDFGIRPSENKWPNREWIVELLSTYAPTCKIFAKDYTPKQPEKKVEI